MADIRDLKFRELEFRDKDISSLSNTPSKDGVTAEELKKRFDNVGRDMIALGKHNELIDALVSCVPGESGAQNIGAHKKVGEEETEACTVQQRLDELAEEIDGISIEGISGSLMTKEVYAASAYGYVKNAEYARDAGNSRYAENAENAANAANAEKLEGRQASYFLPDYESHTMYVSPGGSDETGDGTESKPFLTAQAAYNSISPKWFGVCSIVLGRGFSGSTNAGTLTIAKKTNNISRLIIKSDASWDQTVGDSTNFRILGVYHTSRNANHAIECIGIYISRNSSETRAVECQYVPLLINTCYIYAGATSDAVYVSGVDATLYYYNSQLAGSAANYPANGIQLRNGARAYLWGGNMKGSSNAVSIYGSIMINNGTALTGSIYKAAGGQYFG